jgi:hypothetical protein
MVETGMPAGFKIDVQLQALANAARIMKVFGSA